MRVGTVVAVTAAAIGLSVTPAAAAPRPGPIGEPPPSIAGPLRNNGTGQPAEHTQRGQAGQTSTTLEPAIDCVSSPEQPNPVVVLGGFGAVGDIRGTLERQMAGITSGIRDLGGCAFIFGYGIIGPMQAAAPVAESAGQLRAFITKLLATTGATHVDIVAHSSGALVANYYLKFLHGGPHVDRATYLAPVTRGTTAATLIGGLDLPGSPEGLAEILNDATDPLRANVLAGVAGALDCLAGSQVNRALLDGGITVPGVIYSVLATHGDQVLTPPGPASFINDPRVENDYFEDLYPQAGMSSHATLPMTPEAAQWVTKQLLSE
ncbi:esterase/lipase family protein [Nocardia sp. CA-145437]|uniref:esterase/lipase family protein n=1 Tax=Nocardia sp. CA-145437 TaxID=3239980 RepID=UPI003D991DCD